MSHYSKIMHFSLSIEQRSTSSLHSSTSYPLPDDKPATLTPEPTITVTTNGGPPLSLVVALATSLSMATIVSCTAALLFCYCCRVRRSLNQRQFHKRDKMRGGNDNHGHIDIGNPLSHETERCSPINAPKPTQLNDTMLPSQYMLTCRPCTTGESAESLIITAAFEEQVQGSAAHYVADKHADDSSCSSYGSPVYAQLSDSQSIGSGKMQQNPAYSSSYDLQDEHSDGEQDVIVMQDNLSYSAGLSQSVEADLVRSSHVYAVPGSPYTDISDIHEYDYADNQYMEIIQ